MKYRINLLPQKVISFGDKLSFFLLNYLRYIIVLTQLVVIGVFFFRFKVDQKIIDLKESVDQKKEIVEIVLPLLQEAEHLDKKSREIEKVVKTQTDFDAMIKYVLSIFPETITLTNLDSTEDSLKLTGDAADARHLQAFFTLLKRENNFGSVEFKSIKKSASGYKFTMSLTKFKGAKI